MIHTLITYFVVGRVRNAAFSGNTQKTVVLSSAV